VRQKIAKKIKLIVFSKVLLPLTWYDSAD
jgi:hypothetical protein